MLGLALFAALAAELAAPEGAVDAMAAVDSPCVALTFDDGPSRHTARLLDGLQERGVQATFFLLGCHLEGNEELVRRMRCCRRWICCRVGALRW